MYGKVCHLSVEVEHKAYWDIKSSNFDLAGGGIERKLQLNWQEEMRLEDYESQMDYKARRRCILINTFLDVHSRLDSKYYYLLIY